MKINSKIQKYLFSRTTLGMILGAIGGGLYYWFVGCASGTCPITSNPYIMILYGTLFGGVLFYKEKKSKVTAQENQEPQE